MNSIPANHGRQSHGQQQIYEDTAVLSSFKVWNNFFLTAGIPASVADEYALTFHQHRVRIDMLKEITKEILLDMGIKAMGDIIAILRHAKNVSAQDELKVGLGLKSSMPRISLTSNDTTPTIITTTKTTNNNNITAPKHASYRQSLTTSSNPSSTIKSSTSLNTSKIQSRVSSHSGALRTSSQLSSTTNHHGRKVAAPEMAGSRDIAASTATTTTTNNNNNNKRLQSSSISDSLAKRLCPAPRGTSPDNGLPAHFTEKTLTVHYPPSYAKALAMAQRRLSNPSSTTKSSIDSPVDVGSASRASIKSRIGNKIPDRQYSSLNHEAIPDKLGHSISSRVRTQVSSTISSRIGDDFGRRQTNHHHQDVSRANNNKNKHNHGKSNVFDRLGGSR